MLDNWKNLDAPKPEQADTIESLDVGQESMEITEEEARSIEVAQVQEEAAALHESTCPKCFWDIREKVLKARNEDLEEYTRSIIAGRPFHKKLDIFGGKLQVGFHENTDEIRDDIMRLIKTINISETTTNMEITLTTRKIQVLFALTALSNEGSDDISFSIPEVGSLKDAIEAEEEFNKRFANRSASSRGILFRAWQEFDRLVAVLSDGAFDENFYKGVGLA